MTDPDPVTERVVRTPAFADAHVHLAQTGLLLGGLDLRTVRGAGQLLDRLAESARTGGDAVIVGGGWDETDWSDPRLPTLAELDRAAGGRVVFLSRVDGHSALVTGRLAADEPRLAETSGWDGSGRIERDAIRVAREAVTARIPRSQRKMAIARAMDAAAAAGIGRVNEMAAPHINPIEDIELIRELAAERPMVAVVPYWGEHASDGGVERAVAFGCAGAAGDLNIDGAFGSRTAALIDPYVDVPDGVDPTANGDPGASAGGPSRGHRYLDADAVAEHVVACTLAGISAGFHCIGDAATAAAAEGFRRAARRLGSARLAGCRHRLEHLELVSPADLPILDECGVIASVQPAFDALWGGEAGMYAERLGVERALGSNPLADLGRAGLRLEFGSDSPVTPFDPWGAVRASVRHHRPDSRLDPARAYAAHLPAEAGTGYVDWLLPDDLDNDQAAQRGWLDRLVRGDGPAPVCLRTVVGGRTVYSHPEIDVAEADPGHTPQQHSADHDTERGAAR